MCEEGNGGCVMGEAGSRKGDTEASDDGAASGSEEGKIRRPCLSSEEPAEAPVAEWLVWGQMCCGALPAEALTSSARPHRVSVYSGRSLAFTVPLQSLLPTRL